MAANVSATHLPPVEEIDDYAQKHAAEFEAHLAGLDIKAVRTQRAAENILERGDVLEFLVRQAQKNHVGDKDIIKHLLASIACTNSLTSAGIQPELNGPKGHGKTDAVRAVFHLIPEEFKLSASVSAKSLYYHQNLLPGTVIFSDDVQWSEDLISTVKRSMGSFQEPQTHFTLDKNRNPLPHTMPPRLVWWLSSVETVADDQLRDRQYSLDIDESKDHAQKVSDFLRRSRAQKKIRFSVDMGIEVAREIIRQVKTREPFKVVIDCAEVANWKVKEDHRTQNKFWDLVEAFAILRYRQRHIDEKGWLHATAEDFNEAKIIFMRRKANHRTHLSDSQNRIVQSVYRLQNTVEGATRSEIAKDLGLSYNAVKKSLESIEANTPYVVHSKGANGETFYECASNLLEFAFREGDIVTLPQDYKDPLNLIEPRLNPDCTSHCTSENDNSNNKCKYIEPKKVEYSNGGNLSEVKSEHCYTQKTGSMRFNEPNDSDSQVQSRFNEVQSKFNATILRFSQPVPAFVGEDMRTYGPFQPDEVGTIPSLNATGLVSRGFAQQVNPAT